MVGDLHIYGGFNLSPYLAMRVFEVVGEIASQDVNLALSHVDDDTCEICRGAAAAQKEKPHDAAEPDRLGHQWSA